MIFIGLLDFFFILGPEEEIPEEVTTNNEQLENSPESDDALPKGGVSYFLINIFFTYK